MLCSRIMTGNKSTISVVYVLILCFLFVGCSEKKDSHRDNGTINETITATIAESTETTETTFVPTVEEGTQSNTNSGDELIPDNVVPNTDSPGSPPDNSAPTTTPADDNVTLTANPSTTPTEDTATTNPESDGNDMSGYGIELPDDKWD